MVRFYLILSAFYFLVLPLHAQSDADLSGIQIKPMTDKGSQVDVDLGIKPDNHKENLIDLPSEWSRFAGGVWTGFVGQGVFGTFPRISADKAFDNASEHGLGIGVQLDFGVQHSLSQALRFRLGYLALGLGPNDKTLETYSKNQLEAKIRLLHTEAMYRWAVKSIPNYGMVWVGAAVSANYVVDSSPASLTVVSRSKLLNTLGVGYQLTAGWDYPVFEFSDLGVELAYHPFRSISALLSLRTSL